MRRSILASVLLCAALSATAQTSRFPPINLYGGDPTGNGCTGNLIQQSSTTGLLYTCQGGTMKAGGSTGGGTVSGQTPAALPLATGTTTIGKSSPLSVDDVNTPTVITNTVAYKGPSVSASVNKVLNVTAPPYNAQCDLVQKSSSITVNTSGVTSGFSFSTSDVGKWLNIYPTSASPYSASIVSVSSGNATMSVTPGSPVTSSAWEYGHDDLNSTTNGGIGSGIQQAFADAGSTYSVQFPAGLCLTSTIPWNGQSFFGAGWLLTYLYGQPAKDVLAGSDTAHNYISQGGGHDIQIVVNQSVNASAAANGGNDSFPYRIAGVAGGNSALANPPTVIAVTPAIQTGPMSFSSAFSGSCNGSTTNGSTTFTLSCGNFNNAPTPLMVGQQITLNGAGSAGATLTTTIAAILSNTTLQIATPALNTSSAITGTYGAPIAAPWYMGNCGIAVPQSDGAVSIGGVNGWWFQNIVFTGAHGTSDNTHGYTCGIFLQAASNALHFKNVEYNHLWGGRIEALPVAHFSSLFAWTPDTSSYEQENFKFDNIPWVQWNGTHRQMDLISIYGGGGTNYALGGWWFSNGFPSGTIRHYYNECSAMISGEAARFSGSDVQFLGGEAWECPQSYVSWNVNGGYVDGQMTNLVINGANNIFKHIQGFGNHAAPSASFKVTDNGLDNRVEGWSGTGGLAQRAFFWNYPREPLGKINGGFIVNGNSATPYTSADDLISTCPEFNFAFQNPGTGGPSGCTPDPSDAGNLAGSYAHLTSTAYPSGAVIGPDSSGQGQGPYGKLWIVGDRLPANPSIRVGILARCSSTCTQSALVRDGTTLAVLPGSATLTFGTSWTWQYMTVSLAAANGVSVGDVMSVHLNAFTGATYEEVAEVAWFPSNQDTVNATLASASLQTNIQGNIGLGGLMMYPCSMGWTGGATPTCATDSTSPYTQQTATLGTSNFARLNSYNGTSLTIGNQFTQNATYTLSLSGFAASAYTETISILCASTVVATPTVTWPTAYAAGNPVLTSFSLTNAACTAGAVVAINFGQPTQITSLGAVTVQQSVSVATPYPGAGIANSTGSAWGTSYSTTGSGTVIPLATNPSFAAINNSGAYTQTGSSSNALTGPTNIKTASQPGSSNDFMQVMVDGSSASGASATAGYALRSKVTGTAQDWVILSGSSTSSNTFRIQDQTNTKDTLDILPNGAGFQFFNSAGTFATTLTFPATAARAIAFPDAAGTVALTVTSGTSAMGTTAITAGTCATVVTTAATGALTTDSIAWAFNAAPSTGYTAGLHVLAYPTAGNVNFLVCNPTAGSLTPAAATLNWRITR